MTKKDDRFESQDLPKALIAQYGKAPLEEQIDADVLTAIGTLIGTAGHVDSIVSLMMLEIVGSRGFSHRIYPLVVGADIGVKIQQLKRLAAVSIREPKLVAIENCADEVREAFKMRDVFAHSMMMPGRRSGEIAIQDIRPDSEGELKQRQYYSASDIHGFAERLNHAMTCLETALRNAGVERMQL